MVTSAADLEILRRLGSRVREIAGLPEQAVRRNRWRRHNSLDPERPLVLCFPEGAWGELLPDSTLECHGAMARGWEWSLRSKIYWWENLHDDNYIEPWFDVGWHVNQGNFGVEEVVSQGANRGSMNWEHPLKDPAKELDRLVFREPKVDRDSTAREMEEAGRVFGGILPVRRRGMLWWSLGMTREAIKFVGLQEFMELMVDEPETVHRLMGWLRDEHLHFIDWCEKEGVLSPNNGADNVGSGGVGCTDDLPGYPLQPGQGVRLADMWGFTESQETVGVSPDMFAEFVLPYQLPIAERFGLNCYGCCEPLDGRMKHVMKIPRLRRVSVSPWANQEKMAAVLGNRVIFSRKPNPAMICASFDESTVRKDLRTTIDTASGCAVEIIMKDTHTIQNQPWRLEKWIGIALEEAARPGG